MLPDTWVIPLGDGSRHNNIELLFMLRGLYAHHPTAIPVVIGSKPIWYKGIHIPFPEDPTGCKENKIKKKVLHATTLYPEFVFANDDHFLLKPFTGDNYYSGTLRDPFDCLFGGPYKKCIENTAKITGWGFPYFDVHTPMIIDSSVFKEHLSHDWNHNCSYILKSLYGHYAKLPGTFFVDLKINTPRDLSEIISFVNGRSIFTVGDDGMTGGMLRFFNQAFPVRSPWE